MPRQYKLARKMKKIQLTAAARELGVSQPTLSSWEGERKSPSIDNLIRMSQYYGVTADFLLGLTAESDPRLELLKPVAGSLLPALHETPVYLPERGWAFVDAIEQRLCFADGATLPFADSGEVFLLPPAYSLPGAAEGVPLTKNQLSAYSEVWVEPISADTVLRSELRGWYEVRSRFVENGIGQRFCFDLYGSKWLAFSDPS